MPTARPERPRADEPPVLARQPAHPEAGHRDRQQHRQAGDDQARERDRQLEQEHPGRAQERPVAELRADARGRATGSTGGRCVSSRRLACRRSPSASRQVSRAVPDRIGRPTHSGVSSTPNTQPAADHQQVRQALAEADEQVQQRAARGAQVRREVQRDGHDAASTETSPLVLSAWIWNGASGVSVSPRMRTVPESLCASIW